MRERANEKENGAFEHVSHISLFALSCVDSTLRCDLGNPLLFSKACFEHEVSCGETASMLCAFLCVCVCAFMHACVRARVCVHVHLHVCACLCWCTRVCVRMCVFVCFCVWCHVARG